MKTRLTILSLLLLTACGSYSSSSTTDSGSSSTLEATLSSIQTNIFTPTCATSGCHSSSSASGGLSLASGDTFPNLVGVSSTEATSLKRVTAGSPGTSYVINKLEGTQTAAGGSGAQMPKNGTALTTSQIQTIKDWITAGASNN